MALSYIHPILQFFCIYLIETVTKKEDSMSIKNPNYYQCHYCNGIGTITVPTYQDPEQYEEDECPYCFGMGCIEATEDDNKDDSKN